MRQMEVGASEPRKGTGITAEEAEALPAPLRAILDQVRRSGASPSNLAELRPAWEAHVAAVRRQIPAAIVEEEGEALYLGGLSPGCRACKDGTWDCIFTTMRCNLDCKFCFSPLAAPRDYAGSLLGSTPEEIAANHDRTRITGTSFSGGEPFLDPPRLFDWVAWFTVRYPDRYYWVYTNGLLVSDDHLRRLAELGVDEVRFNLAATGYDHPAVLGRVAAAARLLTSVTVEIPAIPEHSARVLSCLTTWAAAGVRFLNLHELMYEPGTNSAGLAGQRRAIVTPDGHRSEINPESRSLTLAAMRRVQDECLPLAVNDCSLQSKLRQLTGRRRCLAPLTQAAHEVLIDGRAFESYCAFRDADDFFYCSSSSLPQARQAHPEYRFVRLVRTAPLSIRDAGQWVSLEWA